MAAIKQATSSQDEKTILREALCVIDIVACDVLRAGITDQDKVRVIQETIRLTKRQLKEA